jgi:hypothetical protein
LTEEKYANFFDNQQKKKRKKEEEEEETNIAQRCSNPAREPR